MKLDSELSSIKSRYRNKISDLEVERNKLCDSTLKEYEEKITRCLLYISDLCSSNKLTYTINKCFVITFDIDGIEFEELLESINKVIDSLKSEVNADLKIEFYTYNRDNLVGKEYNSNIIEGNFIIATSMDYKKMTLYIR